MPMMMRAGAAAAASKSATSKNKGARSGQLSKKTGGFATSLVMLTPHKPTPCRSPTPLSVHSILL
jgi:hypothetical protein